MPDLLRPTAPHQATHTPTQQKALNQPSGPLVLCPGLTMVDCSFGFRAGVSLRSSIFTVYERLWLESSSAIHPGNIAFSGSLMCSDP